MPALALDTGHHCPFCGNRPWLVKEVARGHPYFFCVGCDRAYDAGTKTQIANWAWRWDAVRDDFVPKRPVT